MTSFDPLFYNLRSPTVDQHQPQFRFCDRHSMINIINLNSQFAIATHHLPSLLIILNFFSDLHLMITATINLNSHSVIATTNSQVIAPLLGDRGLHGKFGFVNTYS
ncbi:MAG: hypothetical protein QNJ33_19460 [Crocosphaera sp.]|nr:hypothetical protein [Crocosphaera sp.]